MEDRDRDGFGMLMQRLAAMYDVKISPTRLEGYFEALRDLSMPTLTRALMATVRNARRFPTVAEIRQAAFGQRGTSGGHEEVGSMPPDVAAQRLRYELDVTLPVRSDREAKFGQRWGIEPTKSMDYTDICRRAREGGAKNGPLPEMTPTDYHATHVNLGIVSQHCALCEAAEAVRKRRAESSP